MAQILVRDLDDERCMRLKEQARRHGRSLQGEAKLVLRQALGLIGHFLSLPVNIHESAFLLVSALSIRRGDPTPGL
jgi:hypothetical protein